jgi:hypothetical protein
MQYLVSALRDQTGLATPDEQAAVEVFNDRLQAEGYWFFAGGPASPDTATVIDNQGEQALFKRDDKPREAQRGTTTTRPSPSAPSTATGSG